MKLFKTICVASASCLMMASCGSKEAELYNQIKTFPSSDLIAQYEAECPDGEHLDSVKTYYAAVVNEIRELGDTTDFQAYLNFSDSIAIDSVKSWALIKADTLLLDSINRNGTVALCETYIKYFPKSKNLSAIEAKKKELKEKAAAEASKKIDALISQYVREMKEIRAEDGMYGANSQIGRECVSGSCRAIDRWKVKLRKLEPQMTQAQKNRWRSVKVRYPRYFEEVHWGL